MIGHVRWVESCSKSFDYARLCNMRERDVKSTFNQVIVDPALPSASKKPSIYAQLGLSFEMRIEDSFLAKTSIDLLDLSVSR